MLNYTECSAESLNSVTNSGVTDTDGVEIRIEVWMDIFRYELIRRKKILSQQYVYISIWTSRYERYTANIEYCVFEVV